MKKIALMLLFWPAYAIAAEPALPMGLAGDEFISTDTKTTQSLREAQPFDLTGFSEIRFGLRIKNDPVEKDVSVGEVRLHLEASKNINAVTLNVALDALYNPALNDYDVNIDSGKGWLDLHEANILFRPLDYLDIKIGRQISTWGTGDLRFINDMFPKDWNSFIIGRDETYLKAHSDAVKMAFYHDLANLDVVYTPRFNADRFIDGHSVSYYNGNAGAVVGRADPIIPDGRNQWFSEDEIALRAHRLIGTYETALYFYDGYWKSPGGQNAGGTYYFPRLSVYGASVRGPLGAGIGNAEIGYYDSREDRDGKNSRVNNSEWRALIGYEQEVATELTASMQYYVEVLDKYSAYQENLSASAKPRDEYRHIVTARLTKFLMNQNLKLSLFNFYSPSDHDGYLRTNVSYKVNDSLTLGLGGNWFYGSDAHTFFDQFEGNSSIYASARWGF